MSNTVTSSKKHTAEAATPNDDAPEEYNQTPAIPITVISQMVLPFIKERRTWNDVCIANKELHEAGMRMIPPWPETKLSRLGQNDGSASLRFSPCGSYLVSGAWSSPFLVYIYDRRGRQTCLTGHSSNIFLLSFSNDGKYLASAGSSSNDASIRIWPTNSTKLPQQSDKTLRGRQQGLIHCLNFSPHDSNILASGDQEAIKLWNVEQGVCIYNFNHGFISIRSMFFPAADEGRKCIFITSAGSLIRTSWDDLSGITSDIVDMPGLGLVHKSAFSHSGSLLAASSPGGCTLTLYNMITMTVVQRLYYKYRQNNEAELFSFLAFSPDGSKTLVLVRDRHEIQICEVHDLNISRRLGQDHTRTATRTYAVAFDPSGQSLASAGLNQNVRIWTL